MDERQAFMAALMAGLEVLGLSCNDEQAETMWRHFELLRAANETVNLTRITEPADAAVRHFTDSLAVAAWLGEASKEFPFSVLDVGTGGGFPALPLAVLRPHWRVTAVDGTARKAECVQAFAKTLGLHHCRVEAERAEHWSAPEDFDVVLFRAVGSLGDCLRKGRKVARRGHPVVCYKSDPLPDDEQAEADTAGTRRSFEHVEDWPYRLEVGDETLHRQLCVYRRR